MGYDITPLGVKVNGDGSVTGGFQVLRDGKHFVDYSVTYYSMTVGQVVELKKHADEWLKKPNLTGLSYKQFHQAQKDFAQHMFKLGDKNHKNK